ncbi:MAG: ATP-grasp domain-containing protein [Gaiellaceae bacterium]
MHRHPATGSPVGRRLLIPDDVFTAVLAGTRALRAAGYEPWIAAAVPGAYASRSRATAGVVAVPDAGPDPEGFVQALAAAAGRLRIAAVLPGTETALTVLAGREADFPAGVVLAIPGADVVRRATDKALLGSLATQVGLQSPRTVHVRAGELGAMHPPLILKPLRSAVAGGGTHRLGWVRRIDTVAELEAAAEETAGEEWVAQEFVDGTLCAVAGVFWAGELVCASHQVAHRIWPPVCGISAYAETVPRDLDLEERVAAILRAIGWRGMFELQLIRTETGRYVIDLNTRFYGSLALAVAAGLNLPAIWVDLELGRTPHVGDYHPGVRYRSEERDAQAILRLARERRWGAALDALRPRRRTTHALFSWRDPKPFLTRAAAAVTRRRRDGAAAVPAQAGQDDG